MNDDHIGGQVPPQQESEAHQQPARPPRRNTGNRSVLATLFPPVTVITLGIAWATVIFFLIFGRALLGEPIGTGTAMVSFVVILAAIVIASFGVVREAEHLATTLGEPFGTLILTLSVVLIEVILISSVMLGPAESATIGRDSIFAVMMIIMNGVMGLGLLLGGGKHGPQRFNRQGASAYMAMIVVLTLCSLVLPSFTSSTDDGSLVPLQSIALSVLTVVLYAYFLYRQTGKDRGFFVQPPEPSETDAANTAGAAGLTHHARRGETFGRSAILVATILPIVLLSHDMAVLIDFGIEAISAPPILTGVLIAMIVFTPEAITTVRASLANETQRTLNLSLGAYVSTVGLTVPSILVIGLITGNPVILGESPVNMLLIGITVALSVVTFSSPKTTAIHGAIHVMLFAVFAILIFAP